MLEKECIALSPQLGTLRVLPLHTGLGAATQHVYTADGDDSQAGAVEDEKAGPCLIRRVILSDALGEASFSLPSVRYVIDTGLELKTVSFPSGCTQNVKFVPEERILKASVVYCNVFKIREQFAYGAGP